MMDRIVRHPGEKRGEVHAELHGVLAALMSFGENKTRTSLDVRVSLVAGERNHLYRTILRLSR